MPVPTSLTTNAHQPEPYTGISGNVSRIPGKTDRSRYTWLPYSDKYVSVNSCEVAGQNIFISGCMNIQ